MTNQPAAGELLRQPYAPPPPQHHHYLAGSSSSSTASLKGCCCCLFLLLIFLSLLAVAVALVIILAVRPRKPEFDLQRVGVEYLLVAPEQSASAGETASAPAAYLSLNITLLFTAENPNKVGIKYEAADLYVLYHGVPLGIAAVPGFEQPAHSTRLVESRVSVSRFNVLQADALELVRDATVNDRVELRITGDVGAKIRVLGFTSPRVQVSVDCVIVISPRKQSLTYKQCGVDGLSV
ncbi:hypothetical protein KFK09_022145 [Dendrobium nobile]|uniref:Late embryogenesis abundant protein LEA-2 subgroup domain-containing protein n=1 Tax=Dendrobium nobile TaxID=94219 RepID=A0A8T3AI58_DENNO|nr:hypothetical protein KFK09_022145 [Dendrobium nobile]